MESDSFFIFEMDFSEVSILFLVLLIWFLEDIVVCFFFISWENNLQDPIVRKIDNKTILNKFVCKGLNAIFVKIWLVFFEVSNLHINFVKNNQFIDL
jgi:hypothetical protein